MPEKKREREREREKEREIDQGKWSLRKRGKPRHLTMKIQQESRCFFLHLFVAVINRLSIRDWKRAAYAVASHLVTTHDCFSLASQLGVSRASLDTLRSLTPAQYTTSFAYTMLCQWFLTAPGNEGKRLFDALIASEKNNIAQKFRQLLLPSGMFFLTKKDYLHFT